MGVPARFFIEDYTLSIYQSLPGEQVAGIGLEILEELSRPRDGDGRHFPGCASSSSSPCRASTGSSGGRSCQPPDPLEHLGSGPAATVAKSKQKHRGGGSVLVAVVADGVQDVGRSDLHEGQEETVRRGQRKIYLSISVACVKMRGTLPLRTQPL